MTWVGGVRLVSFWVHSRVLWVWLRYGDAGNGQFSSCTFVLLQDMLLFSLECVAVEIEVVDGTVFLQGKVLHGCLLGSG